MNSQENAPEPLAYSVDEVALLLGISPSHCRRLVRIGQIPCRRLGRRIVIPRRAIDLMLLEETL